MRIEIEGKKYDVKTTFQEYTIKDLAWANPLLAKNDMSHKWCIDFLLNSSNIPLEVLELIDFESELKPLTEFSLLGLRTPDSYLTMDYITLNGKKYHKREELSTLSGINIILGKNNFKQFALMGQLHDAISKAKELNGIALAQLNAVLYGEDFSDKAIDERSQLFMDLDLLSAYSGFFLFQKDLNKFQNFTSVSSKTKITAMLNIELLLKRLSRTIFGYLLRTKWLKWEFLLKLTKHL